MRLGSVVMVEHKGLWAFGQATAFSPGVIRVKLSRRESVDFPAHTVYPYKYEPEVEDSSDGEE